VFWTTAQIAAATGLSQRHVGHLLRHKVITGYKTGHDWIVQEEEAQRFVKEYNEGKKQLEEQESTD